MPAVSQKQAALFRLVNAYKAGALKKKDVSPQVVAMAKDLTKKQVSDYITAKKNAPETVAAAREDMPSSGSMDTAMPDLPTASIEVEDIAIEDLLAFLEYLVQLEAEQTNAMKPYSKRYIRL